MPANYAPPRRFTQKTLAPVSLVKQMPQEPLCIPTANNTVQVGTLKPEAVARSTLTLVLLIGGLALFSILVWRSGPDLIRGLLLKVGWALPFVFLPHALVTAFEASGWWFAFPQNGCPIKVTEILRFSVAAKAIQHVTPSISQAGELLKFHLLRLTGISADSSMASVVAAKTTITLAELLFIGVGLGVILSYITLEPLVAISLGIGILVMGLAVIGLLVWQRMGLFRPLVLLGRRFTMLTKFLDRHEDFLSSTDRMLREYIGEGRRFYLSWLGYFLGWAAGVLEAWVFLRLLGLPHDPMTALLIQAWLVLVTRFTAFVPGNLGTHEAGAVMIFSFLGLTADSAMAFALLRRIRQIVWIALGLGLLAKVPRAQQPRLFS
jgi:glycosyltransferase 2 family protein